MNSHIHAHALARLANTINLALIFNANGLQNHWTTSPNVWYGNSNGNSSHKETFVLRFFWVCVRVCTSWQHVYGALCFDPLTHTLTHEKKLKISKRITTTRNNKEPNHVFVLLHCTALIPRVQFIKFGSFRYLFVFLRRCCCCFFFHKWVTPFSSSFRRWFYLLYFGPFKLIHNILRCCLDFRIG